jgi:hypothetical protein
VKRDVLVGPAILVAVVSFFMFCFIGGLSAGTPGAALQSQWLAQVNSNVIQGYGNCYPMIADATPVTQATTGANALGVHLVDIMNPTANTVYISLNGSTPSTTTYNIIVPARTAYRSVTQTAVTSVKAYAASASTIYIVF